MSLQYILARYASSGGLNLENAAQQTSAIADVNQAAEELYKRYDLLGSLSAQYFRIENQQGMMISLPYFVGAIRAVRLAMPNIDAGLIDFRPRFQSKMWSSKDWLKWTLKGEHPLKTDITNEGPVTVTFTQPVEKAIRVTIAGETLNSAEDVETLNFAIGDTTKTTTKIFRSITPSKNITCLYNASILDMDGNELALIPNNQTRSLYLRCMVYSPSTVVATMIPTFQFYELLWKYRFRPFVNLVDEFMCPGYDDAIYWKLLELKWRNKQATTPEEAGAFAMKATEYEQKAAQDVADVSKNAEQSIEKIMNIGQEPIHEAFWELENSSYLGHREPSNIICP